MPSVVVEALFAEGARQMMAGDDVGAEVSFRQVVAQAPELAEVWINLGLIRQRAGEPDTAEASFRQALRLDPACVQAYLNLAVLLLEGKRFVEAEALSQAALWLAPASAVAWSNYGVLLACGKREAEAEQCYRTALALDPAYRKARFNFAYVLLRQGRFAEGWACLEARDWYAPLERHFACPRWQGESLVGKSVVVGCEAGYGDMIQFSRYVPWLKQRGAIRVSLICHPGLKSLLSTLPAIDQVYALDDEIPTDEWDFWSPALSLPGYCQMGSGNLPAQIPYLWAPLPRVAHWQARLPTHGLRVGVVWKGNPLFENDADRSLPSLAMLLPLSRAKDVCFISLQKGAGQDEALAPPPGMNLLALGHELADFADTAALVGCLDLVISVDTAVAHLAGALGRPCWVLLPDYKTDWRWLTDREDSPWYPGVMRLFRQPPGGGWESVVATVADELVFEAGR